MGASNVESKQRTRLLVVTEDGEPEANPDDFAEMLAAVLAFRTLGRDLEKEIASRCGLRDVSIIHDWANGVYSPISKVRRSATAHLREIASGLLRRPT